MPGPSKLATAYLLIRAQTGQLTHDLNKVRRSFIGQMSSMAATAARLTGRKFVNVLTSTLKWGMLAATGIMAGTIWGSLKLASAAEEIENKYRVVFKGIGEEADAFVKDFRERFGLATTDLRAWMAAFQDTFVPLGFARKEAMKLSASLVELSVDLSSFHDTDPALAMRRMTSALVGNHEAVRAYGIVLTESVLNAKLLEQGIRKTSITASAQEKVLARLAVIMDGTADAQGDMERSANSYANTMRRMWANIKQLFEGIGNILMPVFTGISNVTGAFAELAAKVVDGQLPKMKKFLNEIKAILDQIANAVRMIDVGDWYSQLSSLMSKVKPLFLEVLSGIGRVLMMWMKRAGEAFAYHVQMGLHKSSPVIFDKPTKLAQVAAGHATKMAWMNYQERPGGGGIGQDIPPAAKLGDSLKKLTKDLENRKAFPIFTGGGIDPTSSTMVNALANFQLEIDDFLDSVLGRENRMLTEAQQRQEHFNRQLAKKAAEREREKGAIWEKLGAFFTKQLDPAKIKERAGAAKAKQEEGWGFRLGKQFAQVSAKAMATAKGGWQEAAEGGWKDPAGSKLGRFFGRAVGGPNWDKDRSGEQHRAAFVGFDAYSNQLQLALSNQEEPQQRMAKALDQLAAGTGGFFDTMGKFFSDQTVKLEKALKAPARAAAG